MDEFEPGDVRSDGDILHAPAFGEPVWTSEGAFFVTPEQAKVAVSRGWHDEGPRAEFHIVRRGAGPVIPSAPYPAQPITEARVAAAFEAWSTAWSSDREDDAPGHFHDGGKWKNEATPEFGARMAAGLFKYLGRV